MMYGSKFVIAVFLKTVYCNMETVDGGFTMNSPNSQSPDSKMAVNRM